MSITFPSSNFANSRREFRFFNAAGALVHVSVRKAGEASDEHESRVSGIKKLAKLGAVSYALANAAGEVYWTSPYRA